MKEQALQKAITKFQTDRLIGDADECWEWPNMYGEQRYGQISVRVGHKAFAFLTHRIAFIEANGPIREGFYICHKCDNPRCVNPAHLWEGTASDNARDRDVKRRGINSAKTHCSKGHEFSLENTIITSQGRRTCRTCDRKYALDYYRRIGSERRKTKFNG